MKVHVQPFTEPWIAPVREFNARLQAVGLDADLQFPESPVPEFPAQPGRDFFQEYYLATESEPPAVRGCFWLTFEPWILDGEQISTSHYRLPVSEGIANADYKPVAGELMKAALARQPFLYCLGMGGFDRPVTKSLKKQGWHMAAIPFFFRVVHPGRFLREMPSLQQSPLRRAAAAMGAWTGTGWAGIHGAQWFRTQHPPAAETIQTEWIQSFGDADEALWRTAAPAYRFLARRDTETLNLRYGSTTFRRSLRLAVRRGDRYLGWAACLDTPMRGNKYFGNLRVGSLIDIFAHPDDAAAVAGAAWRVLAARGVDLIVANFSHRAWQNALTANGFWRTSSNYVFAVSVPLGERLAPMETSLPDFHITRADGPGPTRL